MAPASKRNSIWSVIVPADGTRAAILGNGDFGTSPIFVQLSDKPLLASAWVFGVLERKAQWLIGAYFELPCSKGAGDRTRRRA
jgi:hypothetical protein